MNLRLSDTGVTSYYIDGFAQGCFASALAMELPQSCATAKSLLYKLMVSATLPLKILISCDI